MAREKKAPKGGAKQLSNSERIWRFIQANPGCDNAKVTEALVPLGVPKTSIPTLICQLGKRKLIGQHGEPQLRGKRLIHSYEALVPSYPGATPSTTPAAPVHVAEPQATAHAAQTTTRSKRVVVHWSQEEIEAVCRKWARDHVHLATSLSGKGLLKVARLDGHGYRPREVVGATLQDAFIKQHLPLVEQFIKEEREAMNKPAQEQAPAQPAPALAPQPELTLGALIDRAIAHAVDESVKKAVAASEDRMLAAFAEMLKGIPGYSRPIIIRHETVAAPEPAKPKYQVVVVGGLQAQFDSVRRAFPELDVRLVTGRMPGEEDPDLVVGVTRFMSHPLDRALKKKYGSRYCPLPPSGAASEIKRTIASKLQVSYAH